MSCVTPDRTYYLTTPSGDKIKVFQKIIPDTAVATKYVASYVPKGHPLKPCAKLGPKNDGIPLGIAIHNTNKIKSKLSSDCAEVYTLATWPNCNMGGVVVHFYVYLTNVWQNLSVNERGYHAADGVKRTIKTHDGSRFINGNLDTIAIEVVGNDPVTEATAAKLCAYLCKRFGLKPQKDIYTHNYFMHKQGDKVIKGASKNCPYYILPHWQSFLNSVDKYMVEPGYVITGTKTVSSSSKIADAAGLLSANGFTVNVKRK